MTKKQQIQHLYNIVRDLSKRIDSLQNKKATVSWAAELKKRIETLEQNQPKSDKSVSQTKGSEPDWENLLTLEDFNNNPSAMVCQETIQKYFNKLIYDRIKPLLDDILQSGEIIKEQKELINEFKVSTKNLRKEIVSLTDSNKDLKTNLKYARTERDNYLEELNDLRNGTQLTEAYMNGRNDLLNRLKEVPFELDKDGNVWFKVYDDTDTSFAFTTKLDDMEIHQKRIKRILLEMEDE